MYLGHTSTHFKSADIRHVLDFKESLFTYSVCNLKHTEKNVKPYMYLYLKKNYKTDYIKRKYGQDHDFYPFLLLWMFFSNCIEFFEFSIILIFITALRFSLAFWNFLLCAKEYKTGIHKQENISDTIFSSSISKMFPCRQYCNDRRLIYRKSIYF